MAPDPFGAISPGALGRTGRMGPFEVGPVSLGAGHVGGDLEERAVFALLDRAVEAGIRLIDTARSYGASEARIGRWLRGRRDRVLISTKVGYGVEGHEDWTGPCIAAGVDRALSLLGTDRIDVVHLHSCPASTLKRGEVVEALIRAVEAGKVGAAAYSGDGADLAWAVDSGAFSVVQGSLSVCDRENLPAMDRASGANIGVIAKRPLANAPWRFQERPNAEDLAIYWDRWTALALEVDMPLHELCVRFAAHRKEVSTVLIGTRRIEHLTAAVAAASKGPLPDDVQAHVDARWNAVGGGWMAVV